MRAQLPQSCLTLCDPMDCGPPGSPVHGILQAGLEWVAVPSSRDLPRSGIKPVPLVSPALQVDSFLLSHWRNPKNQVRTCSPRKGRAKQG